MSAVKEPKPNGPVQQPKKIYFVYTDEAGIALSREVRLERPGAKKQTWQEAADPDRPGEWIVGQGCMTGVRRVPFELPGLIEALKAGDTIFIVEGPKKCGPLREWGFCTTCCMGGAGAASIWREHAKEFFLPIYNSPVVILPDNDAPGAKSAATIADAIASVGVTVSVLNLPVGPKGDIIDWLAAGGTREKFLELSKHDARLWAASEPAYPPDGPCNGQTPGEGVSLDDFRAFMEMHAYIFMPSGAMWPAASVNSRIPPIPLVDKNGEPLLDDEGKHRKTSAAAWLDKHRPVEMMTWAPGEPRLIPDRLISDGGWVNRKGVTCFNLYRQPVIIPNKGADVAPWLDHAEKVYPSDAGHIIKWLAHRVQHPEQKINHALVLGGNQGVGKDTLLEPAKRAIGPWNFLEVSPQQTLEPYNGFLKSVILRVNEARDLGEVDRFKFYDHMKAYTAAPPDVLRVNEKYLRAHYVFNCTGLIITSNHKGDGIFLPADDRRHFVAWSDLVKEDFEAAYWNNLWSWYEHGGFASVAAFLRDLDLSAFDPKAPPPKTAAFWDIVDANRAPEDAELADVLDEMGNPDGTTLLKITWEAGSKEIAGWLKDRKNRRLIPHRLEKCGYVPVRNDAADDGLWKIGGSRQVVYGKSTLSIAKRFQAARNLLSRPW
jgi:Family of unknown function (DUF5906)